MNTHFAGTDISTNAIRAELIVKAERGDKRSTDLLRVIANKTEANAGELVTRFRMAAGSASLEIAMAGLGLVSFGLVLGIMGLIAKGFVVADIETLLILLSAFVTGQWGLITYSKMSSSRYYAQELQKLASIMKVSNLVKEQYAHTRVTAVPKNLSLAYGSVA